MEVILVLGIVGYLGGLLILDGWVLSVLWGWFMVPTFGLPTLTLAPAIGVALVVSFLTLNPLSSNTMDEDGDEAVKKLIIAGIVPFVALLIGWIVHACM